jgi:hypothetical protein
MKVRIDPFDVLYIDYRKLLIEELPKKPTDIDQLLPWNIEMLQ